MLPSGIVGSYVGENVMSPCVSSPRPKIYRAFAESGSRREVIAIDSEETVLAPAAVTHFSTLPSDEFGKGICERGASPCSSSISGISMRFHRINAKEGFRRIKANPGVYNTSRTYPVCIMSTPIDTCDRGPGERSRNDVY